MSPTDDDLKRLAAVVDRQRQEMERLRSEAVAGSIVATATGLLMERLDCSAADAMAQLGSLAEATGVTPAEMAATVIGAEPPAATSAPAAPAAPASPAPVSALAVDGTELAATLAGQVASLGVETVAVWLLAADGALDLLGASGFGSDEKSRWRHIPPQLDCVAQRVAQGKPDQWWKSGRTGSDSAPVTGSPEAVRGVLALRDRAGELLGVLELRWRPGHRITDAVRETITALAAGSARALGARLAHGDITAAQPKQALFELLDQAAGSLLAVRAIRDVDGAITDFAIEHLSPGYLDPAGRPPGEISGQTLLEAYPLSTTGHGLFSRALRVVEEGSPQHLPGPLAEPVPLADFRAAKFFDGAIFTWRSYGEAGGLSDLLDHVQRLGRLGGWEENLVSGSVRWTDSAFEILGLQPSAGGAIRLSDLHSYVIAADKAPVRRFAQDLPAGRDAVSTTFRIVRPDDSSVRQVRVFAEPVADATGTVVALRGAFQDVSAHYLTQVALAATRDQLADTEQRAAEEHRLALRLQRAILPPEDHPVEAAGIDIAVRYRPAGRGHLVGGDWYDTLLLPGRRGGPGEASFGRRGGPGEASFGRRGGPGEASPGREASPGKDVLLIVGDVAGHGIEAVTGMIAARNALRGLAVTGAGPAELLRLLNVTLCELVSGVIGTVVCGVYSPAARVLRWARAGHLPPVLIRGGHATALPLPGGVLLGMDPDAEYEETTASLQPADLLVFFTDGLIERRGESIGDALGQFVAAAGCVGPHTTADACADRLLASATSDTDDDACLVTVRILLSLADYGSLYQARIASMAASRGSERRIALPVRRSRRRSLSDRGIGRPKKIISYHDVTAW